MDKIEFSWVGFQYLSLNHAFKKYKLKQDWRYFNPILKVIQISLEKKIKTGNFNYIPLQSMTGIQTEQQNVLWVEPNLRKEYTTLHYNVVYINNFCYEVWQSADQVWLSSTYLYLLGT